VNYNINDHPKEISLAHQPPGFHGRIVKLGDDGTVAYRLRELGFVVGTSVKMLRRGPLGDPVELELRGYRICLRRTDLASIYVESASPEPE
jgi:ferrous iron transport protein A